MQGSSTKQQLDKTLDDFYQTVQKPKTSKDHPYLKNPVPMKKSNSGQGQELKRPSTPPSTPEIVNCYESPVNPIPKKAARFLSPGKATEDIIPLPELIHRPIAQSSEEGLNIAVTLSIRTQERFGPVSLIAPDLLPRLCDITVTSTWDTFGWHTMKANTFNWFRILECLHADQAFRRSMIKVFSNTATQEDKDRIEAGCQQALDSVPKDGIEEGDCEGSNVALHVRDYILAFRGFMGRQPKCAYGNTFSGNGEDTKSHVYKGANAISATLQYTKSHRHPSEGKHPSNQNHTTDQGD
jgi:hypothetical protein